MGREHGEGGKEGCGEGWECGCVTSDLETQCDGLRIDTQHSVEGVLHSDDDVQLIGMCAQTQLQCWIFILSLRQKSPHFGTHLSLRNSLISSNKAKPDNLLILHIISWICSIRP